MVVQNPTSPSRRFRRKDGLSPTAGDANGRARFRTANVPTADAVRGPVAPSCGGDGAPKGVTGPAASSPSSSLSRSTTTGPVVGLGARRRGGGAAGSARSRMGLAKGDCATHQTAQREDSARAGSGGVVKKTAVDVSPLRRINLALYMISIGAREAAFRSVRSVGECLADEIIACAAVKF